MSNREKIILVVTVLVVLYGGYTFLLDTPAKTPGVSLQKSLQELNQFVLTVAASLPKKEAVEKNLHIIDRAAQNPIADFFAKPPEKKAESEESDVGTVEPEIPLIYSGYIEMGGRKLAIINGFEYQAGDPLRTPGYYVQDISPGQVLIGIDGKKSSFVITFQERQPLRDRNSGERLSQ